VGTNSKGTFDNQESNAQGLGALLVALVVIMHKQGTAALFTTKHLALPMMGIGHFLDWGRRLREVG
jgi:hypothetical protein